MFKNFKLQTINNILFNAIERKQNYSCNKTLQGYILLKNVAKNPTIINICKFNDYIAENDDDDLHDNLVIDFKYFYMKYKMCGTPIAKRNRNKFYYNMYKLYCLIENINGLSIIKHFPPYKKIALLRKQEEYFNLYHFGM